VDIRYNFTFDNGEKTDIVGASNRTTNSLLLMEMDENGSIVAGSAKEFDSNVNEVYGFCMYFDKNDNKHYAFINGKDGNIEQWEISDTGQRELNATVVRTLKVNTQPEGMVADDESGYLYVGEELEGIWKFVAGADEHTEKTFVPMSGEDNPAIEFDVEGLSIYYGPDLKGYLIASSQGNYTYAIFEREGENEYITSFSIGENIVDAVEETDGIAVTNTALGNAFPDGVFVVQDGYNYDGENPENQNFKYVDWRKIANLTDPPLIIDTSFNIRRFSE
jgi:3-phytase